MTEISGKIYQLKNAAGTENRFPRTVMEAVLGLNTYLQQQFGALADIYMPIEGISEALTDQEFVFRKSPNTIKAKSLTLDRIKGRTLVWNQHIRPTDIRPTITDVGVTYTNNGDGTISMVGTATRQTGIALCLNIADKPVIGHKIYKTAGSTAVNLNSYSAPSVVITAQDDTAYYVAISVQAITYNTILKPKAIDLTLLYGTEIDGLTDAEILAKYEADFDTGYHEYNEGTLISNDASALETVGFNQWDEEWESGYINNGTGQNEPAGGRIRSKNYIPIFPNTAYFYKATSANIFIRYYDADKNYIGSNNGSHSSAITSPANALYMRFSVDGATYNHDICINLSDESKNGTYEPYRKNTLNLGLNAIKVKSHNIWDEEFDVGFINTTTGQPETASTTIRSKNYCSCFPNTTYYVHVGKTGDNIGIRFYWYDANKNFISTVAGYYNSTIVSPTNAYYFKIVPNTNYGTTYDNDICINLSSSFNGQYEPHGVLTINGVKSAGSVHDEIKDGKYIKRIGEVDFGDLTYNIYDAEQGIFRGIVGALNMVLDKGTVICVKYIAVSSYNDVSTKDKTIAPLLINSAYLFIHDSAFANKTSQEVKTLLSGVTLYYELATPIEYELVEPLVPTVKAGTTEARISPNADGLSAPFRADITYSASENNDAATSQYAARAGRLLNAQTIWGQTFDGSSPVSGALTGVTTLNASGAITAGSFVKSGGTASQFLKANGSVDNTAYYHPGNSNLNTVDWAVKNLTVAGTITGATSIDSLLYFDTINGRVGVGTSSPAHKLDVTGTFRATGNSLIGGTLGVTGAATLSSTLAVTGNTTLSGALTIGNPSSRKNITVYGNSSLLGFVYVGKDAPSAPCYVLDADSQAGLKIRPDDTTSTQYMLFNSGLLTVTDGIVCNGYITAGAAAASSDARLKDNISAVSTDKAFSILSSLRGAEWDWNEKSGLYGQHGSGLVAQEVQKVMPWAVLEFNDKLSLNYNSLWGIVIPVIQNLKKRIEELESRLA